MVTSKYTFLFIFTIYHAACFGVLDQSGQKFISQFIKRYTRPLTVFEACGDAKPYSLSVTHPKNVDVTSAVLMLEQSKKIRAMFTKSKPNSIVLMAPRKIMPSTIKILSRCEQPDVVILHAVPAYFRLATYDFITPFLKVGDYLMADVESQDLTMFNKRHADNKLLIEKVPHENGDGGFLAVFKTDKEGLEVPRWTSEQHGAGKIKYFVKQSFAAKSMFKKDLKTTSKWEKGINLLTFVMLSGVYPSDEVIISEIKKLSHMSHNDLVIGNLLIQGTKLKAIDFNDERHDISVERCVKALLTAFKKDRKSFETPHDFHDYYRNKLLK